MDGFKSLPKMQCFKEGGSVKSKPVAKCYGGKMKEGGKADLAQDKAVVKKAFAMHDKQEHHGEKTDLSKLKKGGRSKKAVGTVKKFANGGSVDNEYSAKKSSGDKDNIRKTKLIKPAKAAAPSKAAAKPNFKGSDVAKEKGKPSGHEDPYIKSKQSGKKAAAPSGAKGPDAFKCGGKVKKYSEGKMVKQAGATEAQSKFYQENMDKADKKAKVKDYEVFGSRGDAARKGMSEGRMDAMGNAFKKGGKAKVKKFADGGAVLSDEEKNWLGGADATDPYILARMRSALGDKKPAPVAAAPSAPTPVRPDPAMIEDESGRGNVTAAQQLFNQEVPGSGINTSATPAAPMRPVRRPAPKPMVIEDESQRGIVTPAQKEFNKSIPGSGSAPYIDIPANNPGMKQFRTDATSPLGGMFSRFFNASPSDQAAQFRRGAEQRKKVGKNIGDALNINKPSEG